MLSYHSPHYSLTPYSNLAFLSKPPVYKLCIFFDTTQSDYCIFSLSIVLYFFCSPTPSCLYPTSVLPLSNFCLMSVQPLSNLCLTSVWPCPTPVSNNYSESIGYTYVLYKEVQHISWSQVQSCYPLPLSINSVLIQTQNLFWSHFRLGS